MISRHSNSSPSEQYQSNHDAPSRTVNIWPPVERIWQFVEINETVKGILAIKVVEKLDSKFESKHVCDEEDAPVIPGIRFIFIA